MSVGGAGWRCTGTGIADADHSPDQMIKGNQNNIGIGCSPLPSYSDNVLEKRVFQSKKTRCTADP